MFDLKGNIVGEKLFRGTGEDKFLSVTVTPKDGIFAVGYSSQEIWICLML